MDGLVRKHRTLMCDLTHCQLDCCGNSLGVHMLRLLLCFSQDKVTLTKGLEQKHKQKHADLLPTCSLSYITTMLGLSYFLWLLEVVSSAGHYQSLLCP